MRIRIFAGIFPVLLCASPLLAAETPDAAQVTERWRAYFQSLQSLKSWSYNAQMRLSESDLRQPAAPPRLISDIKIRFASALPSFYREMQVRESEKAPYQFVALAYNGKKHQMAVQNPAATMIEGHAVRKLMLVGAKPFADDPTLKTNFHLPLAMPFIFVSEDVTEVPFSTLQKADFWADVQKRIAKITPGTWDGHSGFSLEVSNKKVILKPKGAKDEIDERIEVFIDEASGLPLHLTNIDNKTQAVIGEIKITQLRAGENGLPAFPLRVEISGQGKASEAAKAPGTGLIEVDSVSMDATIDAARFTIPHTSMEIVMENDQIIYASFPLTAPKKPAGATKSPAKVPVKTPAKAPAKTPAKRR